MDPEKLNEYLQEEEADNTEKIPEGAIPVELTQVVTYKYSDIVDVLTLLNEKTPVVGIDAMRNIVRTFDTLNNGLPHQAYINSQTGELIDPTMVQMGPQPGILPEVQYDSHPELISEGEPISTEQNVEEEA